MAQVVIGVEELTTLYEDDFVFHCLGAYLAYTAVVLNNAMLTEKRAGVVLKAETKWVVQYDPQASFSPRRDKPVLSSAKDHVACVSYARIFPDW